MGNKVILVTQRVEESGRVSPDSKVDNCSQCKEVVWIAPTSLKKLEEGAEIICTDCFFSSKKEVKLEEIAEITEEQLNEVEEVLGYRPSKEKAMEKIKNFFKERRD